MCRSLSPIKLRSTFCIAHRLTSEIQSLINERVYVISRSRSPPLYFYDDHEFVSMQLYLVSVAKPLFRPFCLSLLGLWRRIPVSELPSLPTKGFLTLARFDLLQTWRHSKRRKTTNHQHAALLFIYGMQREEYSYPSQNSSFGREAPATRAGCVHIWQ
jgi:hypothetical protein